LEFALGLEPIVQLAARFAAAFETDFVCAATDAVFVTLRARYQGVFCLGSALV
jgi:p-aminobenzoyl-glutamate transporter AbgT